MAESNNRKPTPPATGTSRGGTGKKPATSKTAVAVAQSKTSPKRPPVAEEVTKSPARASSGGKKSSGGTKSAPKKGSAPKSSVASEDQRRLQDAEREARKNRFVQQFLPYILVAVGLFLSVCFVVDAFGGDGTSDNHPMGLFGYYICVALFGMLGWTAYLIPAVLVVLTVFWRRYYNTGRVIGKIVLSAVLIVLLSSVGHVFLCYADPTIAALYNPVELFDLGVVFESGGVIGGLLGFVLYLALRLPGTLVLALVTLPLIIMCLVGVTPVQVFGKLWAVIKARSREAAVARAEDRERRALDRERRTLDRERRAQEQAMAAETEDEYDEEPLDESPAPRVNRSSRTAKADRSTARATDRSGDRPSDRRYIRLDPVTGEVLEDEDTEELTVAPARSKSAKSGRVAASAAPVQAADSSEDTVSATTSSVEVVASTPADAPDAAEDLPWEDGPAEHPDMATRMRAVHVTNEERTPGSPSDKPIESDPSDFFDDDEDFEEDDTPPSTMIVGLDDEPEDDLPLGDLPLGDLPDGNLSDGNSVGASANEEAPLAASMTRATPRVSYEVVTEADEAVPVAPGAPVTVRILKSETDAVDERGLSDEEVVLPSGGRSESADADDLEPVRQYVFPTSDMLTLGPGRYEANEEEIAENTQILREVLESFRIGVREIECSCGPTITRFEVKPDVGVRVRSIANLVDDIAMGLAKAGVRIEAPIPGKSAVGIEVPNAEPSMVYLRNILETPEFRNHKSRITACLGADVSGRPVMLDINKMPHLLIAGATGTGKSVCINSLIMSILFKAKPDEVKLILIDPKKVEFAMYRDLPHLYAPVVSDPKKAAGALNSAVNEMERRFELIEEVGVRNLAGYNEITAGDSERPPLPQMVIIIDELADLMMTAPSEVETAICRLAQKARAAGIHLVIGTQRPSVDVITGLIKANVPSRIAFTVKSGVDSRTILDTVGAEKLIGRGDMLYAPIGASKPMRVQGAFVSESEVERVVTYIKEHNDPPEYNEDFTRSIDLEAAKCGAGKKKGEQMAIDDFAGLAVGGARKDKEDPKFWEALEIAVTKDKIGTSAIQRGCSLGYARAAKIIDRMEELGFVGPDDGTKQGRKIYITKQELAEYRLNGLPDSRSEESETEEG